MGGCREGQGAWVKKGDTRVPAVLEMRRALMVVEDSGACTGDGHCEEAMPMCYLPVRKISGSKSWLQLDLEFMRTSPEFLDNTTSPAF